MAAVTVPPLRQRGEILFVFVATAAIIGIAAGLIALKKNKTEGGPKHLKSYQISGISDLTGNNQGIYTDLYTAALDIEYFHQANKETWPPVAQMEYDKISPFVQDELWGQRGRLAWREQATGMGDPSIHNKAYVGKSSDLSAAGNFMILFEHYHSADGTYYLPGGRDKSYSIWFRADKFDLPPVITEGTLVQNGWKEVVSFTGKDQRKELNR